MLVHLCPTKNVDTQARSLLAVLERLWQSESSEEAVINYVGNDFILVEEVALRCPQMIGPRFRFSNFFEEVWKFWKLNKSDDFPSFHVNHLVVKWRLLFDITSMFFRRTFLFGLATFVHHNQKYIHFLNHRIQYQKFQALSRPISYRILSTHQ